MARITVEDCLQEIDNRFDLVLVAARRARGLRAGEPGSLAWNDDKATVLALREVAAGNVTDEILSQPIGVADEEVLDLKSLHEAAAAMPVEEEREEEEDDEDEEGYEDLEVEEDEQDGLPRLSRSSADPASDTLTAEEDAARKPESDGP